MKKQMLSEEFRRMQKLAGIITESQFNESQFNESQLNELSSEEQEIVNMILGENLNEGINFGKILTRLVSAAKRGLLTLAVLSAVLYSCGVPKTTEQAIKDSFVQDQGYQLRDTNVLSQMKKDKTAEYKEAIAKYKDDMEHSKTGFTADVRKDYETSAKEDLKNVDKILKDIATIDSTLDATRADMEAGKEVQKDTPGSYKRAEKAGKKIKPAAWQTKTDSTIKAKDQQLKDINKK